jgi:hypothetical protein
MKNLSHKHTIKKTHLSFIEFDDVITAKLANDSRYFGEGNSQGRELEFDFEYCLTCGYRLLDAEPILTQGILEQEFERFVTCAKNNRYVSSEEITVQHTDFEALERLIKSALAFGRIRENKIE